MFAAMRGPRGPVAVDPDDEEDDPEYAAKRPTSTVSACHSAAHILLIDCVNT